MTCWGWEEVVGMPGFDAEEVRLVILAGAVSWCGSLLDMEERLAIGELEPFVWDLVRVF